MTVVGCDGNNMGGPADMAMLPSNVYTPFSASNFAAQQARVGVYEEIVNLRKAMGFDRTKCGDLSAPAAGTIAEIYTRNDSLGGVLREKLKGRVDDHHFNHGAPVGEALDKTITEALDQCNAGTLEAKYAGQLVDKSIAVFLYHSVYHELTLGMLLNAESPEKWDEAFGYYGRSADGATSRGLARIAASRDMNFGLTLNNTIFVDLIKGRTQVASKDSTIAQTVEKLDRNALLVLAYSTAREFVELPAATDKGEKLAEGKGYYAALEPWLKANAIADATFIRAQLDATTYANAASIDAAGIVSRLEKAFGIDVTP